MNVKRTDFPVIKEGVTYLDSGASSLKPLSVIEAMDKYYKE